MTRKVCDGAARKFARLTKVDERNEGEERLIETSANRSYVPAICYGIHYIYTSYYQPLCSTCYASIAASPLHKFLTRCCRNQDSIAIYIKQILPGAKRMFRLIFTGFTSISFRALYTLW